MISRDNTIQISSVFDAQIQPECGTPNMYVTLRKMDDAWFDLVDEKLTEHLLSLPSKYVADPFMAR